MVGTGLGYRYGSVFGFGSGSGSGHELGTMYCSHMALGPLSLTLVLWPLVSCLWPLDSGLWCLVYVVWCLVCGFVYVCVAWLGYVPEVW